MTFKDKVRLKALEEKYKRKVQGLTQLYSAMVHMNTMTPQWHHTYNIVVIDAGLVPRKKTGSISALMVSKV